MKFNKQNGALSSWKFQDTELLAQPLRPDFWRAPNDNERGRNMAVNHLELERGSGREYSRRRPLQPQGIWRYAHTDAAVESFEVRSESEHAATVVTTLRLPTVQARWRATYTVFGDGETDVTVDFLPENTDLPPLPRLGLQLALHSDLDRITWFGPGPQETYCDRKDALVGLYSGAIADQFYWHYSEPGDSGNKVDVRWAALTNRKGRGLLAIGSPLLSVNALPYTAEDLQNAKHPHELTKRDYSVVNLDWKSQGVGGDDSWGAWPHEEYLIPCEPQSYRIRIHPIANLRQASQLAGRAATPLP